MNGGTAFAHGTWDDARAMIGEEIGRLEGADPVSLADIRRTLEAVGLDCPIHYDESAAREAGYETVVAPVSMLRPAAMPAYWSPGDPPRGEEVMTTPLPAAAVPGIGDTMVAVSVKTEYLLPVHPGDRISAVATLESVTEKSARVGDGAFLVVLTTYSNETGANVALERTTLFRYAPKGGEE